MPTMKATSKFTSLAKKPETNEIEAPSKSKDPKVYYPTLYLDQEVPGLTTADLNQKVVAEVQIVPTSITKTERNGKKSVSYSIDVQGIKIK